MNFLFILPIFAIISVIHFKNPLKNINLKLMRFFRDLSRSKSRRRLHMNNAALMPMLFGKDEPMSIEDLMKDIQYDGFTMTATQLREMDGRTPLTPIYLAVKGLVYDVSANRHMYGPGKGYHDLAGRDATPYLSTGCLDDNCLTTSIKEIDEETKSKEADRWLELYHNNDKYKFVGKLVVDPVEEAVKKEMNQGETLNNNHQSSNGHNHSSHINSIEKYDALYSKGLEAQSEGRHRDALLFWREALDTLSSIEAAHQHSDVRAMASSVRKAELMIKMVVVLLTINETVEALNHMVEAENMLSRTIEQLPLSTPSDAEVDSMRQHVIARLARTVALKASLLNDLQQSQKSSEAFARANQVFQDVISSIYPGGSWKVSRAEAAELRSAHASSCLSQGFVLMKEAKQSEALDLWRSLANSSAISVVTTLLEEQERDDDGEPSSEGVKDGPLTSGPSHKQIIENALKILQEVQSRAQALTVEFSLEMDEGDAISHPDVRREHFDSEEAVRAGEVLVE